MTGIQVRRLGSGPSVVLVHGSLTTSTLTWAKQEVLAERWSLVVVDRRGYGASPHTDQQDYEVDAADVVPLLAGGAHLVGHSYGAIGALFAAAARPSDVRSLTLVEPPAQALLRGDAAVERQIADYAELLRTVEDPADFLRSFFGLLGAPTDSIPSPLPPVTEHQARLVMTERSPWEADLPTAELRAAGFPVLVVSGGYDDISERACDALAEAVGPQAERAVIPGRGHMVQRIGAPFNERLEQHLHAAEVDPTPLPR
jgi:pimeloyl-ACP methyl ester carboxylesterase